MLETKIENLTKQIEQLNNNFEAFFKSSVTVESESELESQVDDRQLEQNDPVVTPESFRDLCLVKSREDKSLKPKIKKILADLGAKVVDDLSPEDLVTANELVRAL
jgi:hypothetical protein